MKLVRADIEGFRRFTNAHIDVSDDVIAIVGPNEAGKTTLLEGLAGLSTDDEWETGDCTRGHSRQQHPIISARFVLSASERELRQVAEGEGETPRWLIVVKGPDGSRNYSLEPKLQRPLEARRALNQSLTKLPEHLRLKGYLPITVTYKVDDQDVKRNLGSAATLLKKHTSSDIETLDPEALGLASAIRQALQAQTEKANKPTRASIVKIVQQLEQFRDVEAAEHPNELLIEALKPGIPRILLFGDQERQIQSEYPITAASSPPAGLRNLFALARIDPREVSSAVSAQDHGRRARIEEKANAALRQAFSQSWSQSAVSAHLQFDEQKVRVQVDAPDTYSPIAERSHGLRAFIALFAFVSVNAPKVKPILLVDEAENHLHYDAQADLVNVFEGQRVAAKVIYSTHSAGCLPSDLGTGIRVVRPVIEYGEDQGKSEISNSFWTTGAGFSPLILAMGASLMAIVPARRAIIAEGGSDVILLPAILRSVSRTMPLGFQIAPGLASVSEADAKELELEAPRVVYLVDGDKAGRQHAQKLRKASISADRILTLPPGKVPEDFVGKRAYLDAVNEELRRSHGEGLRIPLSKLGAINRPHSIAAWCKGKDVKPPTKKRIAVQLAGALRRGDIGLEKAAKSQVSSLLERIREALFMGPQGSGE